MHNNKVIYTCIIGLYDGLLQPEAVNNGYDYICFVGKNDNHPDYIGCWKIVNLPLQCNDDILTARWAKLNPHILLPDYEYSIWIDGNIVIASSSLYEVFDKKIYSNVLVSGINHPVRNCVYDEAVECSRLFFGGRREVFHMVFYLKIHRFPKYYGLFETNVLLRKHCDPTLIKFDSMWWHFVQKYVNRDQLSNSYCLNKFSIPFDYIIPKEFSTRNHPYFKYIVHKKNHSISKRPRMLDKLYYYFTQIIAYGLFNTLKKYAQIHKMERMV